ncbi:MAG: DMT family transporter [Sulfuricurvum sp.]|uniref:DMT family transporter n=1 Tax=Sulfuricurvum sp. TaxID=2025608 RepID=UPI0025F177FE|nr:DMT family transporter [Sulfuricurvum sp.]MCI4406785.1 DMT family transporter [Sulfuricurvum sp.]
MKKESHLLYFIGMIVAMLLWGVAWTAGKVAAHHSNAEVAAFWRYAFSLISIIPLIWVMKSPLRSDRRGMIYMIAAGLLTSVFNYFFFAGLLHGQAGYGGTLVTSISPIITYILSIALLGLRISTKEIIALSVGMAGALVLLNVPTQGWAFLTLENSYFVAAAFVWALVTIVSQKASKHTTPMLYTTVVFAVAMTTNLLFALPYHPFDFTRYDTTFWWTILFIGIFPGTLSTALFFASAGKVGAHRTGVFMFLVPIGAIVSSIFVYGERVELSTLIGCVLAFAAVILFNIKTSKK